MRLASFSVHNYRAFADATEVELRPLTLLFGYNSAGKSALLRWLPLVAASSDPDATSALALDSVAARGATFGDLLSRYSAAQTLGLGLRWSSPGGGDGLRASWRLLWESRRKQQIVERFEVERGPGSFLEVEWALEEDVPAERRQYDIDSSVAQSTLSELTFDGLIPRNDALDEAPATLVQELAAGMRDLRRGIHWLTALRRVPARGKTLGSPHRRMGFDGEFAGEFLAHDRLADGELLATVSRWFEEATGYRLEVRLQTVDNADRFSLVLSPIGRAEPVRIPLADTGEGMAQVLPVIVLGALARHGRLSTEPILLLEHPELHLHPKAHAHLAGFFCDIAAQVPQSTVVVETHSENFLLRVQLAIARGELNPDHVIVHWVRSLSEGPAVVDSVTFDALARPQGDWPPGVFSSDIRQARELIDLRRTKSAS